MAKELNEKEMSSVVGGATTAAKFTAQCTLAGGIKQTVGPAPKAELQSAIKAIVAARGTCSSPVQA